MSQDGWQHLLTTLSNIEKRLYPNPKEYKDYEELTIQYTYARGATELLKQFFEYMTHQETVIDAMVKRMDKKPGRFSLRR